MSAAVHAEDGFLRVDGVRLEWRWVGARTATEAAPPLVLLHEGLGSVGLWKDFPERLADATGRAVFAWSRAGFGASDGIALPRPLDYLESEVPMVGPVLDAASIGRCVLIGHSDGGTIALLYAARPDAGRVAAVVTLAAHVFVEDVTIAGIVQARRIWEEGGLRDRLRRWHGENVDGAFYGWCDTWLDPGFRGWNIEAALPGVRVPVLVMQGLRDQYGTPAQVDAIVRGVAGPAEPLLLEAAGHAPHQDQPDAVIGAIRRFLNAVDG